MTDRLFKKIDSLAAQAGIKEVTPEIRKFAWLVNQESLIGFWEAAQKYAKFESDKVASFLGEEKKDGKPR